jgi:6-phosphogluconolactonase
VRDEAELVVLENAEAATEAAAARIVEAAAAGGHIGLSGGSGPRPAYERTATLQPDWRHVELWWIDERCVPPADGKSNYRLVRESLLDGLTREPVVHRVRGELAPDEAADEYDAALDGVTLDFALMGIGPDGHTASLFPNASTLDETERRAVAAEAGMEPFVPRVTMTRPMLAAARTMVYLVTGERKAEAVERAFALPPSPATPASLVRGQQTIAILDRAAAARLPGQ